MSAFSSLADLDWLAAGVTTRERETSFVDQLAGRVRAVAAARQVHGAGVIHVAGAPDGAAPGDGGERGGARVPGDPEEPAAGSAGGSAFEVAAGAWRDPGISAWRFSAADALMTTLPGVIVAVSVADCLPAIVVDPEHRAIGVAHAGWRGLAAGVLTALVEEMNRAFATRAEACRIGLGPAIGPCCYLVGEDVVEAMRQGGRDAAFPADVPRPAGSSGSPGWRESRGRYRLDLWATAERELRALGIRATAIESLGECTACDPGRYFSRRRDGAILGRMWGYAAILD